MDRAVVRELLPHKPRCVVRDRPVEVVRVASRRAKLQIPVITGVSGSPALHAADLDDFNAKYIFSAASGRSKILTPTASWSALAMAAAVATMPFSPICLAAKGPGPDGDSTKTVFNCGISLTHGIR